MPLSLATIGLVIVGQQPGVREAGRIFAVPTYLFVGSCAVMLLVGLGRLAAGHLDPVPAGATAPLPPATASVGVLLILHAFAAGCAALTGVEAISNGVPAFRPAGGPQRPPDAGGDGDDPGHACSSGSASWPSGSGPTLRGRQPEPDRGGLARWVLGASVAGHSFFYLFQAATLAILVLAANTCFADYPRLVSVRGRRRVPAPAVHQARPAAGVLRRRARPVGGGGGRHPGLPGRLTTACCRCTPLGCSPPSPSPRPA